MMLTDAATQDDPATARPDNGGLVEEVHRLLEGGYGDENWIGLRVPSQGAS